MNFLAQFNLGETVELGEKKQRHVNEKPLEEFTVDDWKERLKVSVRAKARGKGKEPEQWRAAIQLSTGILHLDPAGEIPFLLFPMADFSKENVQDKMNEILAQIKAGETHNDFIMELGKKVIETTTKAREGRQRRKDKAANIEDLESRIVDTENTNTQEQVEEQLTITENSPAKAKESKEETPMTPAEKRKETMRKKKEAAKKAEK